MGQSILGMISSDEFRVNVVAGLAIFVLDVVLIAVLLPRIIEWRRERSWRPARRALVRSMVRL